MDWVPWQNKEIMNNFNKRKKRNRETELAQAWYLKGQATIEMQSHSEGHVIFCLWGSQRTRCGAVPSFLWCMILGFEQEPFVIELCQTPLRSQGTSHWLGRWCWGCMPTHEWLWLSGSLHESLLWEPCCCWELNELLERYLLAHFVFHNWCNQRC